MFHRDGDMFTTEATYIGHGVNCAGIMGKGVAETVRKKYPQTYLEYKRVCETGLLRPGGYFPYHEGGKVIVNLATQNMPGPDAAYPAVFLSLYRWAAKASDPKKIAKYGNVMAIPEIGCGIGGLDWLPVESIIASVESIFPDIQFEVWHYKK